MWSPVTSRPVPDPEEEQGPWTHPLSFYSELTPCLLPAKAGLAGDSQKMGKRPQEFLQGPNTMSSHGNSNHKKEELILPLLR